MVATSGDRNNSHWTKELDKTIELHQAGEIQHTFEITHKVWDAIKSKEKAQPLFADTLCLLADLYGKLDRLGESATAFRQCIEIRTNEHSAMAREKRVRALLDYGAFQAQRSLLAQAENLNQQAILTLKDVPKNTSLLALARVQLAELYVQMGRYDAANHTLGDAFALYKNTKPQRESGYTRALLLKAVLTDKSGDYIEAERLYREALKHYRDTLPDQHPDLITPMTELASFLADKEHRGVAEQLFKEALGIAEQRFGPNHTRVAGVLNEFAFSYKQEGYYTRAEPMYLRALDIFRSVYGSSNSLVADSVNNLAWLYGSLGQLRKSERMHREALRIRESVFGPDHAKVAHSLNGLGIIYALDARKQEAEQLHRRALRIKEALYPEGHPDLATSLGFLSLFYQKFGRWSEAEKVSLRALEIIRKVRHAEHPEVAIALMYLGNIRLAQKMRSAALKKYRQALTIFDKSLGAEHYLTGLAQRGICYAQSSLENFEAAVSSAQTAVKIFIKHYGEDNKNTIASRACLSGAYRNLGDNQRALGSIRLARKGVQSNLLLRRSATPLSLVQRQPLRKIFGEYLAILFQINPTGSDLRLLNEGFEAAQLGQFSHAADALSKMTARFREGSGELAQLARERDALLADYHRVRNRLARLLAKGISQQKNDFGESLQDQYDRIEKSLSAIDSRLATKYPDYFRWIQPKPQSLAQIQTLLDPDEAMVTFYLAETTAYAWIIRPQQTRLVTFAAKHTQIESLVTKLRSSLDQPDAVRISKIKPFDSHTAHRIYEKLFAPLEAHLTGVKHIYVVPDGPLTSLPFAVLLRSPIGHEINSSARFRFYKDGDWLIQHFAFTYLPAVGSLITLKHRSQNNLNGYPFIGFGDPALSTNRDSDDRFRFTMMGAETSPEILSSLPALPASTQQLGIMSKALGGDQRFVFTRNDASESRVKIMSQGLDPKFPSLADFRVIAFATHGLINGLAMAEPGLVLSPPPTPSTFDDGLLAAGEIAQLKLNADWVVLAACRTAAPDGRTGADGLNGLARAFFYAGSHSLLVSHWSVEVEATTQLMEDLFRPMGSGQRIRRAEALQQAMIKFVNQGVAGKSYYRHPMFWAPFFLVGDGGAIEIPGTPVSMVN